MAEPWLIIIPLLLDALIGDPPRWPHLIRWIGLTIDWMESLLRTLCPSGPALRLAGVFLAAAVPGLTIIAAGAALALAHALWEPLYILLSLFMAYQCLAAGQLWREAQAVMRPLQRGRLEQARRRLAMIVGRETAELDEAAIRRAVIETVAENLSDGVIAPLLYLLLFGPVGALAYKAINTLDSMVGYKNEKFADLGWASAKLDDAANWLPARITGWLLVMAARLCGLDYAGAKVAMQLEHRAHKSPNAGWPEAACAGALGVRLGGPSRYHGRVVTKPWLGGSGRDPDGTDVQAALKLMWYATALAGLVAAVLAL